jgi:hypothetical protein
VVVVVRPALASTSVTQDSLHLQTSLCGTLCASAASLHTRTLRTSTQKLSRSSGARTTTSSTSCPVCITKPHGKIHRAYTLASAAYTRFIYTVMLLDSTTTLDGPPLTLRRRALHRREMTMKVVFTNGPSKPPCWATLRARTATRRGNTMLVNGSSRTRLSIHSQIGPCSASCSSRWSLTTT